MRPTMSARPAILVAVRFSDRFEVCKVGRPARSCDAQQPEDPQWRVAMPPAVARGYALVATLLVEADTGLLAADLAWFGGATPTPPPPGLPARPPGSMAGQTGPRSCSDR